MKKNNNYKLNICEYFFMNFITVPLITILVALLVFISMILNYPIIIFIIACLLPSPYSTILCIICATIVFIQLREKYPNIFWLIQSLQVVGFLFY